MQGYRVGLTWWREAWELWIDPRYGTGEMLRIRVDPADNELLDLRTHDSNGPPDDEPGAATVPGSPADQTIPGL